MVGPLSEALESVYATSIKQGSLRRRSTGTRRRTDETESPPAWPSLAWPGAALNLAAESAARPASVPSAP